MLQPNPFLGKLLVFDGGIGTQLYQKGFFINRPFEELNSSAPGEVRSVHSSYIEAGAEVLTTNTFAITRPQLRKFDIESQQSDLISCALANINLAVAESGKPIKIAFSMGPLGDLIEPLGPLGLDEAQGEFERVAGIASALGRFDYYILETFTNIDELLAAIRGIRSVDLERPIVASVHVISTQLGFLADFVSRIGNSGMVQGLGLNCAEGPSDIFSSLKKLVSMTELPIIVQPNAGLPKHLNGRYFYMTSPDYFAKYAKRYAELGASGVGGCCGTGPEHIKAIRNALQMFKARRTQEENVSGRLGNITNVQVSSEEESVVSAAPNLSANSNINGVVPPDLASVESGILRKIATGDRVISVEVLPPKGTDLDKFLRGIEQLEKAGVDFVNIPDGARASTRIGSLHIAGYLAHMKRKISVMPHFTTRDRNLIALQADLLGAYVNGVRDILLVTGDPPKLGTSRDATGVYDIDAIGLTYLVGCLNRGVTTTGDSLGKGTSYGIGVATNPTAINLETEIRRWGFKVESGAQFAVTQPIFDPESFFKWRDLVGKIYRPHLVGIWPLLSLRNAEFMANEIPGVHVPIWVLEEMAKAGDDSKESAKRGIEVAQKVMKSLEKACEGFCISAPLGKVDIALEVLG